MNNLLLQVDHERRQKEKWAKCPPIVKDFYEEHPDVVAMSDDAVTSFRRENNSISVSGFPAEDDVEQTAAAATLMLKPCPLFEHSFWRYPAILETIRRQGFERPSPIQSQAWPYLLKGKDLIGIAQTGTCSK
jgi:ATP-dependent RNA helicase DDX43